MYHLRSDKRGALQAAEVPEVREQGDIREERMNHGCGTEARPTSLNPHLSKGP